MWDPSGALARTSVSNYTPQFVDEEAIKKAHPRPQQLNTGVFMLRASTWSAELLRTWVIG